MIRKGSIFFKLLLLVYFGVVAYLCFGHFDNLPNIQRYYFGIPTDKIVHFLMFFPFPILSFLAIDKYTTKPWHSILFAVVIFIIGCTLAGGTELVQSRLTYRSCDIRDFRADSLALIISTLLVFIIDIAKQKKDNEA